ncbi:MAG TPA: hypothetical protein VK937_07625, partial [Candidatus Limnocylindria bacterium]|nr:hypothetical protein [Candidatus Limnocylindria bacterium]
EQVFPAQLQIVQRLVHGASYLNVYTHSDYQPKKRKTQHPPTNLSHTPRIHALGGVVAAELLFRP